MSHIKRVLITYRSKLPPILQLNSIPLELNYKQVNRSIQQSSEFRKIIQQSNAKGVKLTKKNEWLRSMLSHINNKYIDYSGCFIHYNTQSPTKWYIKYHYKDKNKMQKKKYLYLEKLKKQQLFTSRNVKENILKKMNTATVCYRAQYLVNCDINWLLVELVAVGK